MTKLTINSSDTLAIRLNEGEMILMTTEEIKNKIEQLRKEWLNLKWYRHVTPEERSRIGDVQNELVRYKKYLNYIQTQHKWEVPE